MNNFTVYTRPDDSAKAHNDEYWAKIFQDDPCDDCSHWLGKI